MQEVSIPPSPNWYLSQIVDCSVNGKLAYGSKESIVLLSDENNSTSLICYAHSERVTSVQFAPAAAGNKLVSSGDDFVVRIWDLDSLQEVLAHIVHTNSQRTPVACWSQADPHLVVSADARGYVVSWDLYTNLTRTFHFKVSFTTVLSSPHNKNVVALGTKTGLVFVMDLNGKGRVIHKLRGHDVEVVSLAWCPVQENIFNPAEEKTCLLASGARDSTIYLWRTALDGRYEKAIFLPSSPSPDSGHRTQGKWTAVRWVEPNTLVAASTWGELIAYNLLKPSAEKQNSTWKSNNWRLLHGKHARGLFGIACQPYSGVRTEDDCQKETILWTVAQDRQVVSCTLSSGKILRAMATLGGSIYCMALSPIDGSRLAVGVGDKSIRIWNLSDPNPDSMLSLWNKVAGKVYAVAWHPKKEGCLAYGTSDGRIGLYDTMGNKPPVIFRLHFPQPIYVLQWGPNINLRGAIGSGGPAVPEPQKPEEEPTPVKKSEYLLYAVADFQACAFDPDKPSDAPVNMKAILRGADAVGKIKMDRKRSALSWKPDFSLLAVGNEDGSVHLLTPHEPTGMRHVRTILVHSKLIQDLAWHPPSSSNEFLPSYSNWLAVASSDSEIRVLDVSELAVNLANPQFDTSELPVAVAAVLKGHKQRVVSLCWNPHVGGQLLSTSYDETAVVWDVPSGIPLRNFSSHTNVVLCGVWSPMEPDFVITGSGDATVRVWRMSAQREGAPEVKKKSKAYSGAKQALPDKSFDTTSERETEEQLIQTNGATMEVAKAEESLRQEKKKTKDRSLFPVTSTAMNEPSFLLKNLERLVARQDGVKAAATTRENGSAAEINEDATPKAEDTEGSGKEDCSGIGSAFFGDKDAVAQLLDVERSALVQADQYEGAFTLDVWRSKIKDAVEEAAKKQKLTDHIVSLSPMASIKVWQTACAAYAEQLRRSGEYIRSANYYLTVHKVEEAINMLLDHNLHRQAIVIAKSRLANEDPFVKDVMRKWATQKLLEGQIEVAANCLVSLEEWIEAADALWRRRSVPHLCVAAQLASRGGADEKAAAMFLDCLKLNADENWPNLTSCLENLRNQDHLKLVVAVHQLLLRRLKERLDPERWLEGTSSDDGPSFDFDLVEKSSGHENGKIPISKQLRGPLQKLLASALSLSVRAEALLTVSINLALAMTYSPRRFTNLPEGFTCPEDDASESVSDVHEAVCKLVKAMEALSAYQLRDPQSAPTLLKLCILLSPKGPMHTGSIFSETTVSPAQKSSRAYLCCGLLNWLMENGASFIPPKVEVFADRKPPLRARRRGRGGATDVQTDSSAEQPKEESEHCVEQTAAISNSAAQPAEQVATQCAEESTRRPTVLVDESVDGAVQSSETAALPKQQKNYPVKDIDITTKQRGRSSPKTGEESGDQEVETLNKTDDQEVHAANHTAESTKETADKTTVCIDGTIQCANELEQSVDSAVLSADDQTPVDYPKPAWMQALDLIKKYGGDVFSMNNKMYFSNDVRYRVLLHQETSAMKEKMGSIPGSSANTQTKGDEPKAGGLKEGEQKEEELSGEHKEPKAEELKKEEPKEGEPKAQAQVQVQEEGEPKAQAQVQVQEEGEPKAQAQVQEEGEPKAQAQVQEEGEPKAQAQAQVQEEGEPKAQAQVQEEEELKSGEPKEEGLKEGNENGKSGSTKAEETVKNEPVLTERQLEIKRLREWFSNFEREQVIVPNPFVCYANLSLVLNETLVKVDQKQTEIYMEHFKKIWEEFSASKPSV